MGRGRALEVLLGADDIPGDLAELYGYVNRSLPDADLDGFVDALASRVATFDKDAIRKPSGSSTLQACRLTSRSRPNGMLSLLR